MHRGRPVSLEPSEGDIGLLLPAELAGASRGATRRPEERLMMAVLNDALTAFGRQANACDCAGRREFHSIEAWFAADDWDWPFSFRNICDGLGLSAARLRAALARWRVVQPDTPVEGDDSGTWLRRFRREERQARAGRWLLAGRRDRQPSAAPIVGSPCSSSRQPPDFPRLGAAAIGTRARGKGA